MPSMLVGNAVSILFLLVLFCSARVFAASEDLNVYGGYGPEVLCVFPMSGPYNLLQRILFYLLLVFAVLCRRQKWLVLGALASAMSYSGAAAIHGFLLASPAQNAIDLDIYGIFAITSSGAMLAAPLLNCSSTLIYAERRKRWIVILWGLLLVVGAIFTASCIHVNGAGFITPKCIPRADAASFHGSLFPSPSADCLYACGPETRLFRPKNDVVAWPNYINRPKDITSIFLPATIIYIFSWIVVEILFRTVWRNKSTNIQFTTAAFVVGRSRIGNLVHSRQNTINKAPDVSVSINPFSPLPSPSQSWLPGPPLPKRRRSCWAALLKNLQLCVMLAHFAAFVVNVVMCEYRMVHLPSNEQPKEVGQWMPWVSVALVVFAQMLNRYMKLRWGGIRRKRLSPRDEKRALAVERWRESLVLAAERMADERIVTPPDEVLKRDNMPPGLRMFRSEATSSTRRNSF
ncbi:predicted protein [Histoplasma capsulatum G186AR]|uniref:Integral membrane protein n=2 Tax=Ajellomyces capsulatus TaxID=5037 RepID=C0NSK4_AJECG|nr:uncharacterized protein HCBG_06134 [Histoplasma capsulatum G186AR]EEH05870.1 predicted protein [Histoplasma capsulatum G186AR]KAG5299962.1 hypothetical protein I7I52_10445 [Histoplasma capsulatum]QSS67409.1 hypothetical protein I7I50_06483 [Histoplasma capsulatum G186AR]